MNFSRKEQYIIAALLIILVFLGGLFIYQYGKTKVATPLLTEAGNEEQEGTAELVVHVCGEVKHPGVYRLPEGKRVIDALEMAGGATEQGDLDKLNLAALLEDGGKIYLPPLTTVLSPVSVKQSQLGQEKAFNLININSADQQSLDSLPGIGSALAKRILDYREQQGFFNSVDDLRKVSGIGEKKFEQLKDLVTVN